MQCGANDSSQLAKLSAADDSYDFIYLNHVLEFVPNDVQVFDELLRLLSARQFADQFHQTPIERAN